MCDWIRREKKLVTLSFTEPHDLEECRLIRIKALSVMTSILKDSSLPCPKVSGKYTAGFFLSYVPFILFFPLGPAVLFLTPSIGSS